MAPASLSPVALSETKPLRVIFSCEKAEPEQNVQAQQNKKILIKNFESMNQFFVKTFENPVYDPKIPVPPFMLEYMGKGE